MSSVKSLAVAVGLFLLLLYKKRTPGLLLGLRFALALNNLAATNFP